MNKNKRLIGLINDKVYLVNERAKELEIKLEKATKEIDGVLVSMTDVFELHLKRVEALESKANVDIKRETKAAIRLKALSWFSGIETIVYEDIKDFAEYITEE